MLTWIAYQGHPLAKRVTLRYEASEGQVDNAVTDVYTVDDIPFLRVSVGERVRAESMPNSDVEWTSNDPNTGQLDLLLDPDDLAALEAKPYYVWWGVLTEGQERLGGIAFLDLRPTPDADTDPHTVYGDFRALEDECPYIRKIIPLMTQVTADLSDVRHKARVWLDEILIDRAWHWLIKQYEANGAITAVTPTEISSGVDHGPDYGMSIYVQEDIDTQKQVIRGYLDDDLLDLTDGQAAEITSLYALYLALRNQPGNVPDSETPLQKEAFRFRALARMKLLGWTARIIPPDDARVIELVA